MRFRTDFQHKIRMRLDVWNAEIERLQAVVNALPGDAQTEFFACLHALREGQFAVRNRLASLAQCGDDCRDDLTAEIECASAELQQAMDRIKDQLLTSAGASPQRSGRDREAQTRSAHHRLQ